MLGSIHPLDHPRPQVVIDPGVQNHPVTNRLEVLLGLGVLGEPCPEVHQRLLHPFANLAHTRPFFRLGVKAVASWVATFDSSETGTKSWTTSPLPNRFG